MQTVQRLYVDEELVEKYLAACSINYHREGKLTATTVEDSLVLPAKKVTDAEGIRRHIGGVVDQGFNFYEPSAHYHHLKPSKDGSMSEGYPVDQGGIANCDQTVIYGGLIFNHLGHFLVECTTRLWYWVEHKQENLSVAFVVEKGQEPIPQIREFLSLLGIPSEKVLFIRQPTRFKKIIVPQVSSVMDGFYTDEFMVPFREIMKNVQAKNEPRIYLSRGKFKSSVHIYGEEDLETVFRRNGFCIIYPERLSLKDQIAYIKGAKEIVSVMGTASHLVVFANQGAKTVTLERTDVIIDEQILINQAAGLDWYMVCAHMNFLPVRHSAGPMILGINSHTAQFFKDSLLAFDERKINSPKEKYVRKVAVEWFAKYSSPAMNAWLKEENPLLAHRVAAYCSKAFLSLRQRLWLVRTDGNIRIYRILGLEFRKKRYAEHKKKTEKK